MRPPCFEPLGKGRVLPIERYAGSWSPTAWIYSCEGSPRPLPSPGYSDPGADIVMTVSPRGRDFPTSLRRVSTTGRNSPTMATAINENPTIALQGQDPWGPYWSGIHPVKASTRSGIDIILAVLTPYLATMRRGNAAHKPDPQRLIVSGTDLGNVMSAKDHRKNDRRQLVQPLWRRYMKKAAFSLRQGKQAALCPNSSNQAQTYRSELMPSLLSRNIASRETSAMFPGY